MTRQEELELLCALVEGALEPSPWAKFLDLLRSATSADAVIMNLRMIGRPFEEVLTMVSGQLVEVQQAYRQHIFPHDFMVDKTLNSIEGRVYVLDELLGPPGDPRSDGHRRVMDMEGITALRQVRVEEPSGVHAWLTIVRRRDDFLPADDMLLTELARVFRGVLRQYVALERVQFEASLTGEAVRRLKFGWFTLDSTGRVLDCDQQGAEVLSHSGVLRRSRSGRLAAQTQELEQEILRALGRVASNPGSRPRAITLSRDPWLDMLLLPAERKSISAKAAPAAIAYVHGDSWASAECRDQLAELFRLSPREAEMALALCRGMTIAESAAEFGVAESTARNQTKAVYSKTGARGLPDLVRIVMRSVLALASAPDPQHMAPVDHK
jgi:DNA-binding CsgD family transcriptional regulator